MCATDAAKPFETSTQINQNKQIFTDNNWDWIYWICFIFLCERTTSHIAHLKFNFKLEVNEIKSLAWMSFSYKYKQIFNVVFYNTKIMHVLQGHLSCIAKYF